MLMHIATVREGTPPMRPRTRSSHNNNNLLAKTGEFTTKVAAGAALIGALALSACSGGESHEPTEPAPTSTSEPAPDNTEAPVERWGDFDWRDPLPEDLEYLNTMTSAEFAEQPKLEQLRWASWVDQYRDEFVEAWNMVYPKSYDAPYELNATSDALTVLQDQSYVNRLAANFGSSKPETVQDRRYNGPLNVQLVEKYLMAYSSGDNAQDYIDKFIAEIRKEANGQALNVATQAAAGLYSYRENAETDSSFTATQVSRTIDGVEYSGWRTRYLSNNSPQDYITLIVPFTDYTGNTAYASVGYSN
jgi:hypothetical protein